MVSRLQLCQQSQQTSLNVFLQPINSSTREMKLKIEYFPIGIGKLRIWTVVSHSMDQMKGLGEKLLSHETNNISIGVICPNIID